VKRTSRAGLAALAGAAMIVVGCGGDAGEFPTADGADVSTDAGEEQGEAEAEADEHPTMPDVIGMDADEAVAELEAQGFNVSTGVIRTTEMEPDLVYRSEPGPGRRVQEGQRVTLRIAAEPRG
jgi:hypothetical protein